MKTKRRQQIDNATSGSTGGAVGSSSSGSNLNAPTSGSQLGGGAPVISATPSTSLLTIAPPIPGAITVSGMASGGPGAGGVGLLPSSPTASTEVQRSMRELSKQLRTVKDKMDNMVHTLENIERAKQRLTSNSDNQGRAGSPSSSSGYARSRLRSLLSTALNEAKNEASVLQAAISLCSQIVREATPPTSGPGLGLMGPAMTTSALGPLSLSLSLGTGQPPIRRGVLMALLMRQADNLPVWIPPISDPDEEPPPLCGAEPVETYYTAKPGDMVAAKVRSDDADDADENWILAEVSCFNQATNKYEVVDIDAEEGKQMHVLSRRRVIPLPLWRANPRTHLDSLFPPQTVVLALYPQTTCFYKGIIDRPPRRVRDPYQVLFEDDCYPDHLSPPFPVAQRYVICYKEEKGKAAGSKL